MIWKLGFFWVQIRLCYGYRASGVNASLKLTKRELGGRQAVSQEHAASVFMCSHNAC